MKWPFSYPVTGNEGLFSFSKAKEKAGIIDMSSITRCSVMEDISIIPAFFVYLRATRMAAIMPGDFHTDWPLSDTSLLLS